MKYKLFIKILSLGTTLLLAFPAFAKENTSDLPPVFVQTAPVTAQTWQTEIQAIGTLNASQGIVLKPEVSGRVVGIYFRSGDYVKAGTPLVQINPDTLKAQLTSAQAKLFYSKANYSRVLDLFKKKVFAENDLDQAKSTYLSDQANVANFQAQLNQTLIRAPFAGQLGLRLIDLGNYITTDTTIANLNSLDPLRVDFSVSESGLGALKIGQTTLIRSSAYPNETFQAKIYAMDSQIDVNTRTLGVRAVLPNPEHKLLPGGFVNVYIQTSAPQKYVTVPETAISYSDTGNYVFRVTKGGHLAVKSPVTLGPRRGGMVAITNGLSVGDIIVTEGGFKITTDQAPIVVAPPEK